ncbi:MAG: M28 family peptidase [Bacteroidales bacterium]|nr:M28 family peptidase [Bacteroidales bacterium]
MYRFVFLLVVSIQTIAQNNVLIDSLMYHATILSSDSMEGRLPGTEGYEKAVNYIVSCFKRYGLNKFTEYPNFKQYVNIEHNRIICPCDFYIIHPTRGRMDYVHGEDYSVRGFSGSGEFLSETAFVGYGIDTVGYNEYENVDVQGKVVLMFKGNPRLKGKLFPNFSIAQKVKTAQKYGAKAILFVSDLAYKSQKPIGSVMCARGSDYQNFPMFEISQQVANDLLSEQNITLDSLYVQIQKTEFPASVNLRAKVYIRVMHEYFPKVSVPNIIAFKEGEDLKLKHQYVLVMAHLDHIGKHGNVIYFGANDNASGSAAVIELARLFSTLKTKRSIIFALLTSEEQGLLGAKYLAKNLPVNPEQIVAAFNFDCIAVGDSIQLGNGKSNPKLFELAKSLDIEGSVIKQTWGGGGADLSPFYELGIPGLYFVSTNSYKHLHLPTDKIDTFNIPLFKKMVALGYRVVLSVANNQYEKEKIIN